MSRRRHAPFVLLVALTMLFVMAVPSAARVINNSSSSGYELNAWWSDDTGDSNVGMADAGSWQGIWVNVSWSQECDEGMWEYLNINGEQYGDLDYPVDIAVDPTKGKNKLMTGDGSGFVRVNVDYGSECDGEAGFQGEFLVELTMDLDGYGALGKSRSSDSTHFPSDSNEHSSMQTTFRMANAVFMLDGIEGFPFEMAEAEGSITAATWRSHRNTK